VTRHVERLDGGLWTAEDETFLEPGQLTQTTNLVYLPGALALNRARGRSAAGTVTGASNVDGLRDITFDNADAYLFAMASSLYRYSAVGDTLTFATLTATQAGNQLEVVHYRNRFFFLNGVSADASSTGTNLVVYLSATAAATAPSNRQHGLLPVVAAPSAVGSATAFSQTVTGYYEYWTTEVAKLTQDGATTTLESAFSSDTGPSTIFVSSTGMAPIISMPTIRNPITTHWRVYRSPKKDKESDKKFPTGFMIAEQATGMSTVTDGSTTSSASASATNFNSSGNFFDWTNATNLTTAGGAAFASASGGSILTPQQQGIFGFNFGGFAGNVKGIQVGMQAYISGGVTAGGTPVQATIGVRDSTGGFKQRGTLLDPDTASKSGVVTATGAGIQTITLGGSTDRWFGTNFGVLADSEFDGNFMLMLSMNKIGTTLGVRRPTVTVYYGATVDSAVQYPAVIYTFGDISAQVSKNHPPPNASTGDLFQDQLVLNDVSNPSLIRWSFPGEPESFPPTYFLDFETRENDQVRLIKVVNEVLIVALDASTWAINYLPSERDSSFDRGKAMRAISTTYGCFNPMCYAVFSPDGTTETLAFVSDSGIHGTDSNTLRTYTEGLDWSGIISRTVTSAPICLINDRERKELLFFYRNDSLGNETFMCLHLSYAAEHMTNGQLKISGPVHMRNFDSVGGGFASFESAWPVQRSTGATDIYLGFGGASAAPGAGVVYRETGTTIPTQDSTAKWASRRMYLAGLGNEWIARDLYGYTGSYSGAPAITYTLINTKTDDSGPTTVSTKSVTLAGQKLHKVSPRAMCEGLQVTAQITASAYSQESFIIDGEDWGEEDSGR